MLGNSRLRALDTTGIGKCGSRASVQGLFIGCIRQHFIIQVCYVDSSLNARFTLAHFLNAPILPPSISDGGSFSLFSSLNISAAPHLFRAGSFIQSSSVSGVLLASEDITGRCNRPTPSCTCYHYPFSCIMTSSNLLPLDSGGAAVSLFFSFYICPCCEFTQMLLSFEVSTIQQVGLRAFSFLLHKKEEVPEIDTLYPWAKNLKKTRDNT